MKKSNQKTGSEKLREKAESLLEQKQIETKGQLSEADRLKLIHELQVHQVELELQNEELLLAKENAEQASEKFFELYDFAPVGYFTLTRNGKIVELNFEGAKLLGKERLFLQNCRFDLFVSDSSKVVFNNFIEKIFNSLTTQCCEVNLSINDDLKNYVYLSGIVKQNNCFIAATDISHRKKLEMELLQAKERAEESDNLKTAFLQNMSHEIRTPMNAIKGFSELLVENHSDKVKLERFTKIIDQRCDDLLDIINDILDIAKIESGELTVNLEEFDLLDLFNELDSQFKNYQSQYDKQNIRFRMKYNDDLLGKLIITDKIKLKQIFVNLITNAFKFTDEGTIEFGYEQMVDDKLLFYVSDTGIGIPRDKQNVVFDRFMQLEYVVNRSIGGTGLGLSIVKGLVNLVGGEIFLESELDKGSKFSFTLPSKLMNSLPKSIKVINKTESYIFKDKTILIVEDDFYNLEYIKEVLLDTGVNLIFAETGQKAVQIASSKFVDLVLMDIQLPDMDGYQASREIRQFKPKLKIIAQTAYASSDDQMKALNEGLVDYISKPIKRDLLLSMINEHIWYQ
ncbi:hybrid sensor histidine kinase/response regulator [Marinifilum flexuosum]|uniref:hybrid sensor histidine kinase/response regulator n=1 Tax=Marinifilum flexuosum TaxID=1117708 RepID=UPI0024916528|nr:response regulator [Marinifilum flexuosum]